MVCSTRPGRVPPVGSGLPARRQPASLPSCHRPGRTGPLAARPGREGYPGRFGLMVESPGGATRPRVRRPARRPRDAVINRVADQLTRRVDAVELDRDRRPLKLPAREAAPPIQRVPDVRHVRLVRMQRNHKRRTPRLRASVAERPPDTGPLPTADGHAHQIEYSSFDVLTSGS